MRPITGCLLLLVALSFLACGDDDAKGGQSGAAPAAEADGRPEPSQPPLRTNAVARGLAPGLLRFEDLPGGWRVSREQAGSPEDTDLCGTNLAGIERQREKRGEAGAAYEQSPSGPYLVETIAAYPPGVAERVLADLAAVVQTCREVTIRDEEGGANLWQLTPLTFPPFGDETLAFREYWPPNGVEALVVYIRRGDRIMTLIQIAVNARVDRLQFESFVSRAYERFLRLDGAR
jgi:hypothetical protein